MIITVIMEKYNLNSMQLMSTPHYSLRKNHTWSSSWIIQRFKEVTQTDQFQDFPSQLPGYQDLSPLSFVLSYQLQYIDWVFISAESVEDCISVKRLNTLNTDLSQFCKTSVTLQLAKQGLFSLIPEATAHVNFAMNFVGFLRTTFLHR